jgi:hypothetical protein
MANVVRRNKSPEQLGHQKFIASIRSCARCHTDAVAHHFDVFPPTERIDGRELTGQTNAAAYVGTELGL